MQFFIVDFLFCFVMEVFCFCFCLPPFAGDYKSGRRLWEESDFLIYRGGLDLELVCHLV